MKDYIHILNVCIFFKEKLASVEELDPFVDHASQMAALDYIVSNFQPA